jgi:hypothetical protein
MIFIIEGFVFIIVGVIVMLCVMKIIDLFEENE